MKIKQHLLVIGVIPLAVLFGSSVQVRALSGVGAQISGISTSRAVTVTAHAYPGATTTIVDDQNAVLTSVLDSNYGLAIFSFRPPEVKRELLRIFASDGVGLSEKVPVAIDNNSITILLPPTLYQNPNYPKSFDALGFVGRSFPGASVTVQLASTTNQNYIFNALADVNGEWQVAAENLPPGKYQAIAKAQFGSEVSLWSQILNFEVLNVADRSMQDLGASARGAIEQFTGALPEPAQDVVNTVNNQADLFSKLVVPAALTIGTLAEIGLVARNILYLLLQAIIAIAQAFGFIKKRQQWGLVYDAVTKRPLVRAIVRLYEALSKRLVETDVTNKSGIFSFLPKPGIYYLEASKPGYIFPSQLVVGKSDGEYHHVYVGGEVEITTEKAVVDVAVPLDPREYKETAKMKWQRFYGKWIEPTNRYLLLFGALLAVLSFARKSTALNFAVLWLYVFGLGFQAWRGLKMRREWGIVQDVQGMPLPSLEVTLTDVEFNRLVSRRITDAHGRYQFVAPPGRYLIRVVTPGTELIPRVKGAYGGEELRLVGRQGSEALVVPKIVVKVKK